MDALLLPSFCFRPPIGRNNPKNFIFVVCVRVIEYGLLSLKRKRQSVGLIAVEFAYRDIACIVTPVAKTLF